MASKLKNVPHLSLITGSGIPNKVTGERTTIVVDDVIEFPIGSFRYLGVLNTTEYPLEPPEGYDFYVVEDYEINAGALGAKNTKGKPLGKLSGREAFEFLYGKNAFRGDVPKIPRFIPLKKA